MRISLKGIIPEEIKINCCKEAGISFENLGGKYETLIEIKSTGALLINGVEEKAPELVGLALIQWANSFSRVMNK